MKWYIYVEKKDMEGLTHRVICATGEKVAGAEALKVAKE